MPITIEPISLLSGLAGGTAIGFGLFHIIYNKKLSGSDQTELTTRLALIQEQYDSLFSEKGVQDLKVEDLQRTNAELATAIEHEKKNVDEKLSLIEKTKEHMRDSFKALSQDALNANQQSFLNLAKENLKQFQNDAKGDLEKREHAIKDLIAPMNKSIDTMDKKIVDLEKAREGAYGELREHLKHMKTGQDKLRSETASLVQALRSPSTRGQWGELQLKRTLEMAGMVENVHYEQQVSVETDEGRQRPDVIVKLPGGGNIIIDAKAPIEAYLDSLKEGISEEERITQLKRHARHVREHMKMLGSKRYWEKFDTPEFVVMFLPGESYLSAALEHEPSLLETSVNNRVALASPTNLISLMKTVAYGWKQEKMAESAMEVSELGKELYKRLSSFGEHMSKLGRGLNNALSSYNGAVGSLERSVLPSARKFDELGITSGQKPIPDLDPIEQTPREMIATELTHKAKTEVAE